ncbi:MAG: PIN domain-containing protein [Terracidiphilus sp.]
MFFDTNVLYYAFSQAGARTRTAEQLLLQGGVVSVQVLNELASAARLKLKMSWPEVEQAIEGTVLLCPNPRALTLDTTLAALRICARYGFAIYDGLIVASALEAGCSELYTEDLQHGQVIDGLRVVNPFRTP